MAFYENTLIARQDLAEKDLKILTDKYSELINNTEGKVIKIENWGLKNLSQQIKRFNKGFFIHFKFKGNRETLDEIERKTKIDRSVIRHLVVKYKKLETDIEYFSKKINEKKK